MNAKGVDDRCERGRAHTGEYSPPLAIDVTCVPTFEPTIAPQGGHHDRQQKIAIGAWESEGGSVAASI